MAFNISYGKKLCVFICQGKYLHRNHLSYLAGSILQLARLTEQLVHWHMHVCTLYCDTCINVFIHDTRRCCPAMRLPGNIMSSSLGSHSVRWLGEGLSMPSEHLQVSLVKMYTMLFIEIVWTCSLYHVLCYIVKYFLLEQTILTLLEMYLNYNNNRNLKTRHPSWPPSFPHPLFLGAFLINHINMFLSRDGDDSFGVSEQLFPAAILLKIPQLGVWRANAPVVSEEYDQGGMLSQYCRICESCQKLNTCFKGQFQEHKTTIGSFSLASPAHLFHIDHWGLLG